MHGARCFFFLFKFAAMDFQMINANLPTFYLNTHFAKK